MRKFKKLIFILLPCVLFTACIVKGIQYEFVADGISRVPKDCSLYRNVLKFDTTLLSFIDTNAIYESCFNENGIVDRLDTDPYTNNLYFYIRFYPNGYINFGAIIPKNKVLEIDDFNEIIHGNRGVYYKENNKFFLESFGNVEQGGYSMGIHKDELTIKGDTIIENGWMKYVKRPLPPEFLRNRVNWYCPELDVKKK